MRRSTITPAEIVEIRHRLNLTQQQLGQMVGVHAMTVSKWERGSAEPTPYNVQQLTLLRDGARHLRKDDADELLKLIAMGLFVGALALIVTRALANGGRRA